MRGNCCVLCVSCSRTLEGDEMWVNLCWWLLFTPFWLTLAVTCLEMAQWVVCCPFCTVISNLEGITSGWLLFLRCLALPLEFYKDNTIFSSAYSTGNADHTGLIHTCPTRQPCPRALFVLHCSGACVAAGASHCIAGQPPASPAVKHQGL